MSDVDLPPFRFDVDEVFQFTHGVTAFVGRVLTLPTPKVLAPGRVEWYADGQIAGIIQLTSERMPGRSDGVRSVETRDEVDVGAMKGRKCELVHRSEQVLESSALPSGRLVGSR